MENTCIYSYICVCTQWNKDTTQWNKDSYNHVWRRWLHHVCILSYIISRNSFPNSLWFLQTSLDDTIKILYMWVIDSMLLRVCLYCNAPIHTLVYCFHNPLSVIGNSASSMQFCEKGTPTVLNTQQLGVTQRLHFYGRTHHDSHPIHSTRSRSLLHTRQIWLCSPEPSPWVPVRGLLVGVVGSNVYGRCQHLHSWARFMERAQVLLGVRQKDLQLHP